MRVTFFRRGAWHRFRLPPGSVVRTVCSAAAIITVSLEAAAQLPTPRLDSVFPAEVQRGGESEVTVAGNDLSEATGLIFDAPGIQASKIDALRFRVTASADAEPGVVEMRAVNHLGVSDGHPFVIGRERVVIDSNKNQQMTNAMPVEVSCAIHGRAEPEQRHYYRLHVEGGQTFHLVCTAFHLDSPMDPVMTLLDANGRTLQRADDENDRDAGLTWKAPCTGDFIVEVHDKTFAGGAAFTYRLSIDGVRAGETVFDPVSRYGEIASRSPRIDEKDPPEKSEAAQTIQPSADVSGHFDDDSFLLDGDPARPLWIEVVPETPVAGADPFVVIEKIFKNSSGIEESKQVVEFDDQSPLPSPPFWQTGSLYPAGKFVPDEKARFRIRVRDRFGGHAKYRLRVTDADGDFSAIGLAECPANEEKKVFRWQPNLRLGGSTFFHVAARRHNYDGEITLGAFGLPPDVHAAGTIPAGASTGVLVFYADVAAKPWAGFIRVFADAGGVMREVQCLSYRWTVDNRDNLRLAPRLGGFAIGVGDEPAPMTIRAAETKTWETAIGGRLEIPLQFAFASPDIRPKGEWQIIPLGVPGLKKVDVLKVDAASATKATLVLNFAKDGNALQPGTFLVCPRANGVVAYKENAKAKSRDLKHVEFGEPILVRLSAAPAAIPSAK